MGCIEVVRRINLEAQLSDGVGRPMPLKEGSCYLCFPMRGACHNTQGHVGNTSVGQEAERSRGKARSKLLLGILQERQGRIHSLEVANLNNFLGLCAVECSLVVWYAALG